MDFHPIESNLRESFRSLAPGRPKADVAELPGLTIASLGVGFQMFNAGFLSEAVPNKDRLAQKVELARLRFDSRQFDWSLWVCEDWIAPEARRSLSRICAQAGLRCVAELPGLMALELNPARRIASDLHIVEAKSAQAMNDFRGVGSVCFHVKPAWFAEVFHDDLWTQQRFRMFVGYRDGEPVATSALIQEGGSAGIYNVAVLPAHRGRGIGQAMTRYAAMVAGPVNQVVLQATAQGFGMYLRMGFKPVTRIVVYAS